MPPKKLDNYALYVSSRTLLTFTSGLLGPFWILFIKDFGGNSIEQFGFSLSLAVFASAITSYYAGKYSDKLGRKVFLNIQRNCCKCGGFQLYINRITDAVIHFADFRWYCFC